MKTFNRGDEMEISLNTRFVTLVGDPLAQSFAARMQNAAYEAAGLDMRYFYTQAGTENLPEIVAGIRAMPSFAGAAFTKPNKVAVIGLLDGLDPLCEKMGACNTVVKCDGKLIGYNTDGMGFLASITKEAGVSVRDSSFFCVGAGGAGRAICSALAYCGALRIFVTDYVEESSRTLVNDINENFANVAEFCPFGDYGKVPECDVVVNASGIGMGKTVGSSPLPAGLVHEGQLCFDACYNPAKTQYLLDAETAGCRTLNGLGMSLYQGAAQIELWTGSKAPVEAMREELLAILAEKGGEDA